MKIPWFIYPSICCFIEELFLFLSYKLSPTWCSYGKVLSQYSTSERMPRFRNAGRTETTLKLNFIQMVPKRHGQYRDRLSFCPMTRGISRALWSSARTLRIQQTFRFEFYLPAWLWASHLTSLRFNSFNFEIKTASITSYHSHENWYNDPHTE